MDYENAGAPSDAVRRILLQSVASLALAQAATHAVAATPPAAGSGRPGEFDFLAGNWKIAHRRLKSPGQWDEFQGEATCWSILAGAGSIEELRIPARDFSGMGIRLFDPKERVWSDYWVNSRHGVLTTPGTTGAFKDGVGTFVSDDEDGGKPIKVRGVWDRITPTSCRWHQATSRDAGKTWEENWVMDWRRA